jgi:hypothetical protein
MENLNQQVENSSTNSKQSLPKRSRLGRRMRYLALHVEQLESRIYLASDLALGSEGASLPTAEPSIVSINLQVTDREGNQLESLQQGQEFLLHVIADDNRDDARGVFAAYLDIHWNGALAAATGPLQYSETYSNVRRGSVATPGAVDEAGACAFLSEVGGAPQEIFAVALRATAAGDLIFSADPAEVSYSRDVFLYGSDQPLPVSKVSFGSIAIHVEGDATPATVVEVVDPPADQTTDMPPNPPAATETPPAAAAVPAEAPAAPVDLPPVASEEVVSIAAETTDSVAADDQDLLQLLAISAPVEAAGGDASEAPSATSTDGPAANPSSDAAEDTGAPLAKVVADALGASDNEDESSDEEDAIQITEEDPAILNLL